MTDKKIRSKNKCKQGKLINNYPHSLIYNLNSQFPIKSIKEQPVKFNTINHYYISISNENFQLYGLTDDDCFAVRLSLFLIELIEKRNYKLYKNNSFSNRFYSFCMKKLSGMDIQEEINDDELLIIYIKQVIHVLWAAEILLNKKGIAKIEIKNKNKQSLFIKLFNSFWNTVKWEEIFPSNINAAKELYFSKNIIKDLIQNRSGKVKINSIINEFFELTGFGEKNDLLLISFIDFYLLTWLKHFGIIKYLNAAKRSPIYIELTDTGSKFLSFIR